MKNIKKITFLILFGLLMSVHLPALAQDKKGSHSIETLLKNRNFIFKANTALPMRGSMVQLTSPYDISMKGDTLQSFLPYFGRAFAGAGYGNQGGIDFTTTQFDYSISDKRKKRWNVLIKPQNNTDVQQMILSVSENGYASLQVISTNRDPITFNGYVVKRS